MFTELRVAIPMSSPHGNGLAFAVIDPGIEHHLIWIIALDDNGEIWAVANPDVRVRPNETMRAPRKSGELQC